MHPAIQLQLDAVGYRTAQGRTLLHPVSLAVDAGQHLAIVGPNGAGKSTLLRMLAGILPLSCGQIFYDGVPLSQWTPLERARHVALLGQSDQADARLRVLDYVRLGCLPHRSLARPAQLEAVVAESLSAATCKPCGAAAWAACPVGSASAPT